MMCKGGKEHNNVIVIFKKPVIPSCCHSNVEKAAEVHCERVIAKRTEKNQFLAVS